MKLSDAPRFLTHLQLTARISSYTYKPGWQLSVYLDPWEGSVLRVVPDVPDAYHPSQTIQLRITSRIPPMVSGPDFDHYVLWRLDQIERHECREWLRRGGKPLYDPHDPIEP